MPWGKIKTLMPSYDRFSFQIFLKPFFYVAMSFLCFSIPFLFFYLKNVKILCYFTYTTRSFLGKFCFLYREMGDGN
jgi:hypothetical protein